MRYLERLIEQVRRETENEDVSSSVGIQDSEFIQYFNDAQHRLQSVISATHPKVFTVEKEIDGVIGQEAYSLPADAYMDNKVTTVEWSPSTNVEDYYHLEPTTIKRRDTSIRGFPVQYIRRAGAILLQPRPQQAGLIRLNYVKRIDELDKRRGVVSEVALSGSTITSLVFDPASSSPVLDTTSLNEHNYLCICDRDGVVKMRNIEFDSIDSATGTVTITSGFTFEDGETIAVGDYVVGGQDTTTHSPLPRMCERYLVAYCSWKILKRDSTVDYAEQQQELQEMEADIINSFADISDDITYVPVLNHWSDWSD